MEPKYIQSFSQRLAIDFLRNEHIIIPRGGALQHIKEFLIGLFPVSSTTLMQIVFSLLKNQSISKEVDHEEALKVYIFEQMRSHCIQHPIQGTIHRNAALKRYVLELHHQRDTQRFKTKAKALYDYIMTHYGLPRPAAKYARNILCNNDYIASNINNEIVLLIFDSVDTKL